jgi:hypothetical protein
VHGRSRGVRVQQSTAGFGEESAIRVRGAGWHESCWGRDMDIRAFAPADLTTALGAVRAIDPYPTQDEDRLLRAVARLHGENLDPRTLPQLTPAATARVITDPQVRRRVVELAVVMAGIDGQVLPVPTANVSMLARALGVGEKQTRALRELAQRHHLLARIDLTRKMSGTPVFDAGEDPKTAARYRALARLPRDSLGFALWEHYCSNEFAFPGEAGSLPERAVFHDLGHILSGYGTDPQGELQQAAFRAGSVGHDGFVFLYFGIVQFHLSLRLAPIASAESGVFNVEEISAALARGAACKVDLSDRWDFWPLLAKPLHAVRAELAVPPLEPPHTQSHLAA